MLHPLPWDGPFLQKVTGGRNFLTCSRVSDGFRTFVPAAYARPKTAEDGSSQSRPAGCKISDSSGCCSVQDGMAEKIPVEPGQGNACAGKVNRLFLFSFVAFPPFNTHN